jgi:2-hydroxy-3-keto-5-methylthiopentenyl-1-phosphate phosphatase
MNKFIVFVDFDRTITTRDNEAILVEFTDGERKVIEEEWVREISHHRSISATL